MKRPGTYRLIVFDWDGTLVDSVSRILACFRRAFAAMDLTTPEDEAVKRLIGLPLMDACFELIPGASPATGERFAAVYRQFWLDGSLPLSKLFPGARELVTGLADEGAVRLAVATGKSRAGLDRELAQHDLAARFDTTRCAGEGPPKPEPGILAAIMAETGCRPEETLMIGDTWLDLLMARNAGVDAVGVLTGGHPREELARYEPLACLESVAQLRQFI